MNWNNRLKTPGWKRMVVCLRARVYESDQINGAQVRDRTGELMRQIWILSSEHVSACQTEKQELLFGHSGCKSIFIPSIFTWFMSSVSLNNAWSKQINKTEGHTCRRRWAPAAASPTLMWPRRTPLWPTRADARAAREDTTPQQRK